ncbi:MAG: SDR family oxidoreductase [Bacteroidota bacterium]|nr:SDR family oxidoreductase [Bacteroidota bacterium]
MKNNIKGKVVAITGASSGIGEATALRLAKMGAKILLGARGLKKLEALAELIKNENGEAAFVSMDVRKQKDVKKFVNLAVEKFGQLDVLVSNAGVMPTSPFEELRVDDWEDLIDVNIKGVLYGIAAALPVFKKQGFGHFINLASTAAYKTVATQGVYSGTKAAVRNISEGLRQEVGPQIRVTIISPGFTRTNPEIEKYLTAAGKEEIAMPPSAVANAILYAIEQPENIDVGEIIIRSSAHV